MRLPQKLSRHGVHGISVRVLVAEVRRPAAAVLSQADRCPALALRVKRPVDASSLRTERIDSSFRAPNKDAPARHRGLCLGAQDAGKTEGPLQLEFRHLLGRELRHLCGLKTVLPEVHAPAVPVRLRERIRKDRKSTRLNSSHLGISYA